MRAVIQRVSHAKVSVNGTVINEIKFGLLILLGIGPDDTEGKALAMAKKLPPCVFFTMIRIK